MVEEGVFGMRTIRGSLCIQVRSLRFITQVDLTGRDYNGRQGKVRR